MNYFFPQTSKQYELINYSEHGTYVDNVLYSCDFSDKINRHVVSSKDLDPSKVSRNKLLAAAQVRQNSKPKGSRRTVGLGVQKIVKACNCTTSSSNLIGGSGAGWEGTALLHHGSYIKLGCAQFVFSITNQATKLPSSGKANSSSSSEKKPVVSWWMSRFFGLCGFYMCDVHLQLKMEFISLILFGWLDLSWLQIFFKENIHFKTRNISFILCYFMEKVATSLLSFPSGRNNTIL